MIQIFLNSQTVEARVMLRLLGLMASCIDLVPWARLHMRPLQLYLLAWWRPALQQFKSFDSTVSTTPGTSILVAKPKKFFQGSAIRTGICSGDSSDRCVTVGMGSSYKQLSDSRCLVASVQSKTHQLARTQSCAVSTANISDKSTIQKCASENRQCNCRQLSEQTGRKEQRGIRLLPNMQFLAKTQTLNKPWEPVFIPKFENYATDPNDLLLCPCRALLAYIKRTEVLRKSQRLFVTYQKNHHVEASKNSIARWIVNTVKYAYEHADTDTLQFVRAHDTRKLSTSWALFNGLSSQEILRAAHWSNETTFTSYYLKDVPDLESRFAKAAILHTVNRRQKKY
ncbi:Hypothetical predicted protein [Mytilus galloprovincialis]|uniref:Tyr recombinase domain-containing protein n=1 Tax=Mytilus galloprovincialis TaxID=29158 RepID=A0A8B6BQP0_MYTGA|nr:Hypothetical predicted protein [Mytilus galloprovincialis]